MEAHQRRHLLSCYLAVVELIEEMDAIAREGRAAAVPGAELARMPEEWWERVGEPLTRIRERLRRLVASEAPEELREHETPQPLAATARWLSILLLRLEEEVDGLEPGRFQRQYGPMPEADAHGLSEAREELMRELARANEEMGRPHPHGPPE